MTEKDYGILLRRIAAVLPADKNAGESGFYRVTSLYFDDIYYTAYNQKLSSAEHRAKFRLRCYNGDDSRISLECKIKHGQYIAKDSALITKQEYDAIICGDYNCLLTRADPVVLEFYKRTKMSGLRPMVLVDYVRQPFVYTYGNVRLTFDREIQASSISLDLFEKSPVYYSALDFRTTVMEVKYDNFLPETIRALLSGIAMVRQPVSKYVLCADKIMEVRHNA